MVCSFLCQVASFVVTYHRHMGLFEYGVCHQMSMFIAKNDDRAFFLEQDTLFSYRPKLLLLYSLHTPYIQKKKAMNRIFFSTPRQGAPAISMAEARSVNSPESQGAFRSPPVIIHYFMGMFHEKSKPSNNNGLPPWKARGKPDPTGLKPWGGELGQRLQDSAQGSHRSSLQDAAPSALELSVFRSRRAGFQATKKDNDPPRNAESRVSGRF